MAPQRLWLLGCYNSLAATNYTILESDEISIESASFLGVTPAQLLDIPSATILSSFDDVNSISAHQSQDQLP